MSVYVSAFVWRHSLSKGSTRLVLLALADIADDDGIVPPHRDASIARLASKANLDERTVRYCLRELEGKDLVDEGRVIRPGMNPPELATSRGVGRRPSRYQVLMKQLEMFGPGKEHAEHDLPNEVEPVDKSVENSEKPDSKGATSPALTGPRPPLRGGKHAVLRGNPPPPESRIDVKAREGRAAAPPPPPVDKKAEPPYTPGGSVIQWAAENGYAPFLHLHIAYFRDYIGEPAKRRKYAANLDGAFRNSVRSDWGNVRMQAKRDARFGQGPDLESWWKTPEGVRAKGLSMDLVHDPKRGGYPAYEIAVIDMAIDRDGWGAWADPRNTSVYGAVINRRKTRGADVPEEEAVNA